MKQIMSDQEVIERLKQGTYQGEKIIHVDFDSRTSSICDVWLASHKRVSFSTAVKALEWVTINEIDWLAENAPNTASSRLFEGERDLPPLSIDLKGEKPA